MAKNPPFGKREEIFDDEVGKNRRPPAVWENAGNVARGLDGEHLRLEFLTPRFVKFKGRVSAEAPPFAALVQALPIQLPMLSAVSRSP
jgi:hypothetical protein